MKTNLTAENTATETRAIVRTRGGKTYPATFTETREVKAGDKVFCRIELPRRSFLNDTATL